MEEIMFMVEKSPEGGCIAKGLGVSIYTRSRLQYIVTMKINRGESSVYIL